MISKKELQFVNQFARQVPFPGNNYAADVIDHLSAALKVYEDNYKNKEYNFLFSNGDEINLQILDRNLAHLLGMDYKNLVSDNMKYVCEDVLGYGVYDQKTSFDMLRRIIERADDVIKNDSNPNNFKILNYYKVMIKSIAFSKLTKFDTLNFGCINFDKKTYEENVNISFGPSSSKFFFANSNEAITPYFMMGIKYDEMSDSYIPETIIAPENFDTFFYDQTLLLPIQVLINDNFDLNKIIASNSDKLQILNMYKFIINTYKTDSVIDIFNDYENMLKENTKTLKR